MTKIILASSSPRRKEILTSLNIPFESIVSDKDEIYPSDMNVMDICVYLAEQKVKNTVAEFPDKTKDKLILGCDTAIIFENHLLGKPKDREEAKNFLKNFSGKKHLVVSGLCLLNTSTGEICTRNSINEVNFKTLSEEEIESYLNTEEWKGAAGGYRIQEKASYFIKEIRGSFSSIMGLPIFELYDILATQNYSVF